ncbi:MAG: NERD domain-containing protein, partial [Deltaproteobacteria bacterium]|nr:NERD domain-containing protein [Deltaproteobacteria bacterium]
MAKLIPLGDCVTRGEQRTLEYLQKFLPDDWVVFGNAQVTSGELTREIDAIVVGDRCVWVVDEKGFGGVITGDEHTWILSDGSARERVLSHILHAAKMVKGKLVAADRRLDQIWIEGLVLLSADDVEVLVEDPRISRTVWKLQGCENKFREIIFPQARTLSPSERETV